MQFGIWISILVSAIASFVIARFYEQPLHWYLFVLIVVCGFFIHTVILILRIKEEKNEA